MDIRELWISRGRLSTKEQAKENEDSAKVKIGMRRAAKVARMEERIRGRRAAARKEEKGVKRVAEEIPEHVGRAVRQGTLQLGAEKEETQICTPLTKTTVRNAEKSTEKRRGFAIMVLVGGKPRTNSGKG